MARRKGNGYTRTKAILKYLSIVILVMGVTSLYINFMNTDPFNCTGDKCMYEGMKEAYQMKSSIYAKYFIWIGILLSIITIIIVQFVETKQRIQKYRRKKARERKQ